MKSFYKKTFNYLEGFKPNHLGIGFSLFIHLSILLFAFGLPSFFKSNKISSTNIIPIEILNISDVTSLSFKKNDDEINKKKNKKIKQKKFNSSDNSKIQKIKLQEKPKSKKIIETKNIEEVKKKVTDKSFILKEKMEKQDNIETLKPNKIKPKLKPIENKVTKNDKKTEDQLKPIITEENRNKDIAKKLPNEKPQPDMTVKSILKDLRNDEAPKILDKSNEEDEKIDIIKDENQEVNLKVSISEMDLVLQQLRGCFNPNAGIQFMGDEMVIIRAKIDKQANVRKDTVQIIDTNISKSNPYYEAITESAVATLHNPICSKLKLPLNKYESWKDLKIIIDYSWIKN